MAEVGNGFNSTVFGIELLDPNVKAKVVDESFAPQTDRESG